MPTLSRTNTRWRDRWARARLVGLAVALAIHAALFLFLPRGIADRLYEALIPPPIVSVDSGAPGREMRAVSLRSPAQPAQPQPTPPEPEKVEPIVKPVPAPAPEEITIAEVEALPSPTEGTREGVPAGTGDEASAAGGGAMQPPRPVHLVVPRVPDGVDKRRARGKSVHLLVQVLPDGSVGEVKVEKGSRIEALDLAALAAARQMRYEPASRGGAGVAQWTRAEMRF